jgi:hypothetical protein
MNLANIDYRIEDFMAVCPYTISDLKKKKRVREVAYWRFVGFFWLRRMGYTVEAIGEFFNHHHSTVLNGLKNAHNAIDGYNDDLLDLIKLVYYSAPFKGLTVDIEQSPDMCVNEMYSQIALENFIHLKKSK